jgi:hypothetical protein
MRVVLNHAEVSAFKRSFPCSGIPELSSIVFEYESNGDLCDIEAFDSDNNPIDSETFDGAGLLALSQAAQPKLRMTTAFRS